MVRRLMVVFAAAAAIVACSLIIPFGDYDRFDAGSMEAGLACDADLQSDPRHCGACGHDCLGATCTPPGLCEPTVVVTYDGGAFQGIAVDDTYAYLGWADGDAGQIARVNKDGSRSPEALAKTGAIYAVAYSPRDGNVYFAQADGTIARTSGTPSSDGGLNGVTFITSGVKSSYVALDDAYVYWANGEVDAGSLGRADLVSLDGGVIVQNQTQPFAFAVDDAGLYWTNFAGGTVMRASKDGTNVTKLASNLDIPAALALDDRFVYFTVLNIVQGTGGQVERLDKGGGVPERIVERQSFPDALAVADNYVYWAAAAAKVLARAPKSGGAPLVLASGQSLTNIAVDAQYVYWGTGSPASVRRVAR